jgi:predicted amidohydrolase
MERQLPNQPLEIAAIPLDLAWQDPDTNVERMRAALSGLPTPSTPRITVFPELTLTGFTTVDPAKMALKSQDPRVLAAAALASEFKTALVFGFPEICEDGRVRNALVFVDEKASVCAKYHKLHLFTQGATPECSTYSAGKTPVSVEYQGWKIGLGVCFDLRFPELFRAYAKAGTHLNILSACWVGGPTKRDQFQALSKAQAILTQSFQVSLNRRGSDPFCSYEGEALVYGPRGETLAEIQNRDTLTDLDPALLEGARKLEILPSLKTEY